jgi:hypothetical protein
MPAPVDAIVDLKDIGMSDLKHKWKVKIKSSYFEYDFNLINLIETR